MKPPRRRLPPLPAALILLLAGLILCPAPAAGGEGPIVRQIEVRGYRGDPQAIKDIIQTQEGQPLDLEVLDRDVARLYQAGHVAQVRRERLPDGVRIIIVLTPPPRVRRVEVSGAGRSWNSKLQDELITQPGDVVLARVLEQPEEQRFRGDKARIRSWCRQRGYRDVEVTTQIARVSDAEVNLTFQVDLGPKYQVKWLRIEGNEAISDRQLLRLMRTRRDTLFTSRRYSDETFEKDIEALQDYYRFKGFPNAQVTYRRTFRGRQGNKVDITIQVEEGRTYPTASVTIEGNQAIPTEELLQAIPLEEGETFSDEKLFESGRKIERRYKEQGYPLVRVRPDRQLNEEGDAYEVAFAIEEGNPITIDQIHTRGNDYTRHEVIRRELEIQPGSIYDIRKLERSERALDRLQFFDTVNLDLEPTEPQDPRERNLVVEVTERQTGTVGLGVGFSSTNAIMGTLDLVQRNFDWPGWGTFLGRFPKSLVDMVTEPEYVGGGRYFRLALMPGTVYSNFLLRYENPYWRHIHGRNESLGWSLYWRTRDQGEWDERRAGLRLSWGLRKYKGDPDTDLIFHARAEAVSVLDVDEDEAPEDADDEEGTHPLLGIGATLERDRTDTRYLPTSGMRWEAGPELVVPHGVTFGVGGARYWTLGDHPQGAERVVSVRGRMDYALGSFPIYERYYAGAPLLRGFEYRGAGPHDNDEPEGGKYRAILSAQYRYPLITNTLYSVFFADTGTVTEDFTLFGSPRASVGFGFRLRLPRLTRVPLSLDFAIPVLKQGDDDTEVVYFSLALPWPGVGLGRGGP
ncbi:MAG: outer membrane protein assembly factor [Candidatus Brocadiia bacterium]